MKRLRVILLFLLLGAIVNVAVAWGCVCWSTTQSVGDMVEDMPWPAPVPNDWPKTKLLLFTDRGIGISEYSAYGPHPAQPDDRTRISHQWVMQAGWPVRSLYEERHRTEWMGDNLLVLSLMRSETWGDGLRIPEWIPWCNSEDVRDFPTRPLRWGFALNSVFYGGLLWSLALALAAQRRRTRTHRHQCPTCRYDLRGHDHTHCPECGEEIRKGNPA